MRINKYIKTIKDDFFYRTIFSSFISLIINLIFVIYNIYLGIRYLDVFAFSISIYYFLLSLIILSTIIIEEKIRKENDNIKIKTRIKNYKISSFIIFVIDFCLITPIILMVIKPKDVNFGLIPAIAMAVYCVYKITSAIMGYKKSQKSQNLSIILLTEIKIISAIVSVLTLQHTLIMVNGGMNDGMRKLSFSTSLGFIICLICFSVFTFLKNKRILLKEI